MRGSDAADRSAIVVQKYGGTSVGSPERILRLARRIGGHFRSGQRRLAIVVSAMAGETNRLIELLRQVDPSAAPKSYDMVVAVGEQVSVGLMTAALEKEGIPAEPLLGHQIGILTDDFHARARIQSIATERLHCAWEQGRVPVVAGFQGMTSDRALTTLGRGGSDTSAVALAVALGADYCEINTDVPGVYTADPRLVPEARLIERLDYEVAMELAALGSKVLHNRSVELAAKYRMPIVVRSSFDPDDARRTEIMEVNAKEALESPIVSGVTLDRNVAKLTVRGVKAETPAMAALFTEVARLNINVDIIVQNRATGASMLDLGFTISHSDLDLTLMALEAFRGQPGGEESQVETSIGLSKISAVGLGMRSHAGVAARMFDALGREGIEILMTSTSEIKISCVIAESDGEKATRCVHALFFSA